MHLNLMQLILRMKISFLNTIGFLGFKKFRWMFYFFSIVSISVTASMKREPPLIPFVLNDYPVLKYQLQISIFPQTFLGNDLSFHLLFQVPTSQKKEGVYDVPKSQPVSVSIFLIYIQ